MKMYIASTGKPMGLNAQIIHTTLSVWELNRIYEPSIFPSFEDLIFQIFKVTSC